MNAKLAAIGHAFASYDAVTLLQAMTLALIALGGVAVVATKHPLLQAFVVGVQGLFLVAFFLAFGAPDVALSQVVVGTFAAPALIVLALAKTTGGRAP